MYFIMRTRFRDRGMERCMSLPRAYETEALTILRKVPKPEIRELGVRE